MSLKKRFNDLVSKQKKVVIWAGIGLVFTDFVASGYNTSAPGPSDNFFGQKKTREIRLEPDLIPKTMLREQRRQLDSLQDTVDKLAREQEKRKQQSSLQFLLKVRSVEEITQPHTSPQTVHAKPQWPLPPDTRDMPATLPSSDAPTLRT